MRRQVAILAALGTAVFFAGTPVNVAAPSATAVERNYTPIPRLAAACCKVCKKGKACGDSCISRDYTCHQGQGCACDG